MAPITMVALILLVGVIIMVVQNRGFNNKDYVAGTTAYSQSPLSGNWKKKKTLKTLLLVLICYNMVMIVRDTFKGSPLLSHECFAEVGNVWQDGRLPDRTLLVAISSTCNWSTTEAMLQSAVDASASMNHFDIILISNTNCVVPSYVNEMGIKFIPIEESVDKAFGWNLAYALFRSMEHEFLFLADTNVLIPPGAMGAMKNQMLHHHPRTQVITPIVSSKGVNTYQDVLRMQDGTSRRAEAEPLSGGDVSSVFVGMSRRSALEIELEPGVMFNTAKGSESSAFGLFAPSRGVRWQVCTQAFVYHCQLTVGSAAPSPASLLLGENVPLPAVQRLPSPQNPFIFFHAEKTGGSTIRRWIINASKSLGLKSVVPCYNVPCPTFDLDKVSGTDYHRDTLSSITEYWAGLPAGGGGADFDPDDVSVFAGHFQYGIVDTMRQGRRWSSFPPSLPSSDASSASPPPFSSTSSSSSSSNRQQQPQQQQLSCFTMVREPIARFISYYYDRVYPWCAVPLSDLGPDEVAWIFESFATPAIVLVGPPSSPAFNSFDEMRRKLFSGANAPSLTRECAQHGQTELEYYDAGPTNYFSVMFNGGDQHYKGHLVRERFPPSPWRPLDQGLARQRMSQCIVGVHERFDESYAVLRHWFPWISVDPDLHLRRSSKKHETPQDLSTEVLDVIRANSLLDIQLYNLGVRRLEKQLQHIN